MYCIWCAVGSVGNASGSCEDVPSSNLGSAPQWRSSTELPAIKMYERGVGCAVFATFFIRFEANLSEYEKYFFGGFFSLYSYSQLFLFASKRI
jgi:hypothetical protein